jgi:heavy metal sensor kinase
VKLNSFGLRLALLSGVIAGVLAVSSGVALWRITYRFNLDRLDRELRNIGQSNLDRVQGGDHWERLEAALQFVAGNQPNTAFVLWVKHGDRVIYASPDWPAALAPESYRVSDRYEGDYVPRPGAPPPPPPRRGEEISPRNPALPLKTPVFHTVEAGGKTWRVGVMGNPYVTLVLGSDLAGFESRMAELRRAYIAAVPVVLLLAAGGAWVVARRALRPVAALTQAAERVTVRGLDQRIPVMAGDPEFNRLITVFNEMLDRLQKSFEQATRFSADASHELKTPLARLQLELEQVLDAAPAGSPHQQVYASLLDEVSRLKAIVQKLLLLALADAGRLELHREPVDLARLLASVIEDCQAQAPHLTVKNGPLPEVRVGADASLLELALQNLVSNAIKYNCPEGRIDFEMATTAGRVQVRVANTGPGIPEADRERVFHRFYRADRSRNERVGGAGLGLSLTREILRAHGGDLELEASDATSTHFSAWLPLETS